MRPARRVRQSPHRVSTCYVQYNCVRHAKLYYGRAGRAACKWTNRISRICRIDAGGGLSYSRRRRRRCKSTAELLHCSILLAAATAALCNGSAIVATISSVVVYLCVCVIKAAGSPRYDPAEKKCGLYCKHRLFRWRLLKFSLDLPTESVDLNKLKRFCRMDVNLV